MIGFSHQLEPFVQHGKQTLASRGPGQIRLVAGGVNGGGAGGSSAIPTALTGAINGHGRGGGKGGEEEGWWVR